MILLCPLCPVPSPRTVRPGASSSSEAITAAEAAGCRDSKIADAERDARAHRRLGHQRRRRTRVHRITRRVGDADHVVAVALGRGRHAAARDPAVKRPKKNPICVVAFVLAVASLLPDSPPAPSRPKPSPFSDFRTPGVGARLVSAEERLPGKQQCVASRMAAAKRPVGSRA